jgi:antagonist of KipI
VKVFEVDKPGLYTTIQDRGRTGSLRLGIPPCGAADPFAYRVANILVGNRPGEAALEVTVIGPVLRVLDDAVIAVTGADLSPLLNDAPMPLWESLPVKRGDRLSLGRARSGCRAYLAVAGGIDVKPVLGSRSTYVAGMMGGRRAPHGRGTYSTGGLRRRCGRVYRCP